ncbi:hypothetical protein COCNU_scaffold016389G000010 [Cocos nucifera]|nr:hypothetical protein [Cocos nucifera]
MGEAPRTCAAGTQILGKTAAFIPCRCAHSPPPYRVHVRRAPAGGPGRAAAAAPTTPEGHPDKSHPGGSMGSSDIADGRVLGCASRGQSSQDPRSGDPNLGPPGAGMGRQWARKRRARCRGDPNPWPTRRCARPGAADRRTHGPTEGREARCKAGALQRSGAEHPQVAHGRNSIVRQRRPLPPRRGIPASPTPGVPKDRAALQTGGCRDARPCGATPIPPDPCAHLEIPSAPQPPHPNGPHVARCRGRPRDAPTPHAGPEGMNATCVGPHFHRRRSPRR